MATTVCLLPKFHLHNRKFIKIYQECACTLTILSEVSTEPYSHAKWIEATKTRGSDSNKLDLLLRTTCTEVTYYLTVSWMNCLICPNPLHSRHCIDPNPLQVWQLKNKKDSVSLCRINPNQGFHSRISNPD